MNHNYPPTVSQIVDDYLTRLKSQLRGMPEPDRDELAREIASHIYESYSNEPGSDEVARILAVLRRIGEPSEAIAAKASPAIVAMGRKHKLPFYILAGVLIAFFGMPLGLGGLGVLIGILAAIAGLLVAYFASAVALVIGGLGGVICSVIYLTDPGFFERLGGHFMDFGGEHLFVSPVAEGIVGIIVSLILCACGLGLLWLGRYMLRGLRFLLNWCLEKIRSLGGRKAQPPTAGRA